MCLGEGGLEGVGELADVEIGHGNARGVGLGGGGGGYLRHCEEGITGVTLLHEALEVVLHELHHHEDIIQLLTHHHLHSKSQVRRHITQVMVA